MSAPAPSPSKRPLPADARQDEGERRVQPRHFHFGPNPAATSGDDADDAAGAGPPSAVRLYRDAIGCVFQFLRCREVATALQVSRGWLAAVRSMASLQLHIGPPNLKAPIDTLAQSAMGRHVVALGSAYNHVKLNADSLDMLTHKMPQLRDLTCKMRLPPAQAPLLFPAALRQLELQPKLGRPANISAALQSIGRLQLLEELTIDLQPVDPQISFAPLAESPQLRSLKIRGSLTFSDALIDQLRALPRLREIHVNMTTQLLGRLLRQPHNLQWQQIGLPDQMDDETAALLPHLPSLTHIDGWTTCERFEWLGGLPNLTDVHLAFDDAPSSAGRADSLVAGLQSCTNIEILVLFRCADLTSTHLAELLPRLPRLRRLTLVELRIDSLSFLAHQPTIAQMTSLFLLSCDQLPLTELRHVHAMHNLETLKLMESFNEPMDSHSRSLYTPPSVLMPQLRSFVYSPPQDNDGDEHDGHEDEDDDDDEGDELDGEAEDNINDEVGE